VVDKDMVNKLKNFIKKQKKFFIPDYNKIFVENYKDFTILHCFFGSLINETIASYLSALLSEKFGRSVRYRSTPYAIIIEDVVDVSEIKELLSDIDPESITEIISEYIENSSLFRHRFIRVAKRFGVVSSDAVLDRFHVNRLILIYKNTPIHTETLNEIFYEKMDVPKAIEIFHKIKKGIIKITKSRSLSPLAKLALSQGTGDVLIPKEPKKLIYETFKQRLLNTKVLLICMNCGKHSITKPVRSIEEYPTCKVCNSRLIAVLHPRNREYINIIKKKLAKDKLKKDEERIYKNIRRTADLVITYGKRAVITLSARGIGPETAARILSKLPKDDETLLQEIFEAEKRFRRTKKYWKL
jgi:ATP-dependent Lhr-like helicase